MRRLSAGLALRPDATLARFADVLARNKILYKGFKKKPLGALCATRKEKLAFLFSDVFW